MKKIMIVFVSSLFLFACNRKDCKDGFSGDNCDMQDTPGSITVNSADITGFPETRPDGAGWDVSDGPDIYFTLLQNDAVIFTSDIKADVSPGSSVTYTDDMPFNISNVDDDFMVKFYDDDGLLGGTELMGEFAIDLYSPTNGFPENIILDNPAGSEFVFTLHVEYNF